MGSLAQRCKCFFAEKRLRHLRFMFRDERLSLASRRDVFHANKVIAQVTDIGEQQPFRIPMGKGCDRGPKRTFGGPVCNDPK